MAAASYHPRILIPKYEQTDNVKPLTTNRGLQFAVGWPNLDFEVSINPNLVPRSHSVLLGRGRSGYEIILTHSPLNRPCGSTSFLPLVTSSVLTVKANFVR